MSGGPAPGMGACRARLGAAVLLVLAASLAAPSNAEEPPPYVGPHSSVVPVVRPGGPAGGEQYGKGTVPLLPLWRAEKEFQSGDRARALSHFLELAYNSPDDERKGFVWMRVAEILLERRELRQALDAVDKAIVLTRARYLALVSMDLKYRIYRRLGWSAEARQVAAYLVDQGYISADPADLLAEMARADAQAGRISLALSEYRRAIFLTTDPGNASRLAAERDALIEGLSSIPAIREAAESVDDADVRAHLYLVLGRIAIRKGFPGMGIFALERGLRMGGAKAEEAGRQLSRLERTLAPRPKIVGLVPLSGKHADIGFAVLSGAEVALRRLRGQNGELLGPVLRWTDTEGQPERARHEFQLASVDNSVIGFIGPLTGEEGHSVSVVFGPESPPALYLGQKRIPEKPFLYRFGLSPRQEAGELLAHLAKRGQVDLILLYPENGYGRGFADAVAAAAGEAAVKVSKAISYGPETSDFTDVIRKAVGNAAFARHSSTREKGAAMKLPQDAVVIADRWERVFLIASQLRFYNVYLPLAGFSGWYDEELIRKGGEAVSGSVISVDYAGTVPGAQGDMFRSEFREAMDRQPSRFEAVGYDGALLLSESFRVETPVDSRPAWELARERILLLRTYKGVTGMFQFGPAGEMRRKVTLLNVELGNFVPVKDP